MHRGTVELPRISALEGVSWRWVLAAGAGVGLIPQLLLFPVIFGYVLASALVSALLNNETGLEQSEQFGYLMGAWGLPIVHMLLALVAASWVARRVGTAPVLHGTLIALVSVVVGQIAGLVYESLYSEEVAKYFALALTGGLLGGIESRATLSGQEALHEASRAICEAYSPQAIANAIGDNPLNPATIGVALWWAGSPAEGEEAVMPFPTTPESWTPWFLRYWPDGLRLDGSDVPQLAGPGRPAPRILRPGELSTTERGTWRKSGVRSVLLLPLVAPAGGKVGLLAVASSGRRFSRSTVRSYQTIGAQAALALENLRLVEEARKAGRQTGVLRERQRMAHEIHDTLAQGFTSIVMNLEAAEGDVPPSSTRAHQHLDQARLTARESLTEARRLVWALRPEALESASLPDALDRLARRWSDESGISAGVNTTGTPCPLPSEVEAMLFRVAQESLNNARKHAVGASRVLVTLSYMGESVLLDVRDDGAGFDPAREFGMTRRDRDSGGFGLRGMRERVEGEGGVLTVESAPGEGSTLTVELPAIPCESSRAGSPRNAEEVT